jgi:hypothetical protein
VAALQNALREAVAQDQRWSLLETLSVAYDGLEHLDKTHDCDCQGWEHYQQCKTAISLLIPRVKSALSSINSALK